MGVNAHLEAGSENMYTFLEREKVNPAYAIFEKQAV